MSVEDSREQFQIALPSTWAELDLLAVLAQRNAISAELNRLDGRAATTHYYAGLLPAGSMTRAKEPVHQFLKAHPEQLVEIEAPIAINHDDLIATARASLEKILGPLSLVVQNAEIYDFRN